MATPAKKPTNLPHEVLRRELQVFIANEGARDPDARFSLMELAERLGADLDDVSQVVRELLDSVGYKHRDDYGPGWLTDEDFRACMGAKRAFPGMGPAETYGTIQGFPVTKFRGQVQTFTVTDRALAEQLSQLKGIAHLHITVSSNNPRYDEVKSKAEASDEINYQLTMRLEVIASRLVHEDGSQVHVDFNTEEVDEETPVTSAE